jgi:hypothetical protein
MTITELRAYARFARQLRGFLGRRMEIDEARAIVGRRIEEREARFLTWIETSIFGATPTPYRRLLELARCEAGDIRRLVHTRGLEGTLRTLREGGVYVSFEEFKGREPIVRSGEVIPVRPGDFDNPGLRPTLRARSSGTTGPATPTPIDLDHLTSRAVSLPKAPPWSGP